MRILIEEYLYDYEDVKTVLHGLDVLKDVNGKVSLGYVGYFFNPHPDVQDCVFILPKVLLEGKPGEEKIFGHISPKDLINPEKCSDLSKDEYSFIYNLSVWIYRAICVFKDHEYDSRRGKKKNSPSIVLHMHAPMMGHSRRRRSNTFLDVLLALLQWNKDNEHFVMYIIKNIHSGFNKTNWTRTIAKSPAAMQPVGASLSQHEVAYLNPVNKRKQINFDEELLVIFFSILQYMKEQYGFPVKINVNFDLIRGKKFERYLNGYGRTRLRQIKYKYFSDKALELWELCNAFFDRPGKINISVDQKEYLLVKSFHVVFEAIIDDLIAGDQSLPKGLLDQEDGKRVDHMYRYHELTNNERDDRIYYIGDSKYYKRGHQLGAESVYKQFTYARNVIQWNMDLFNDGTEADKVGHIKLRHEGTEGYNIIPNFFISAHQETLQALDDIHLSTDKKHYHFSRHFENRLFDRDTFLIAHYDVNFLFVIALYGRNKQSAKAAWREKVRVMFRREIQSMLSENFLFYAITPHEDVNADNYIAENFQKLLGKIFKPYEDEGEQQYFSLALRKPESADNPQVRKELEDENETTRQIIDQYFYRAECPLGIDPRSLEDLPKVTPKQIEFIPKEFRTRYYFEAYGESMFLIGGYKSNDHLNWIFGRNGKRDNMYNIRVTKSRDGAISKSSAIKRHPDFLFLYSIDKPTVDGLMTFRIHNAADTPNDFMVRTGYPNPKGNYVSYVLEPDSITFGDIDIVRLLADYKSANPDNKSGAPIFMKGKDIIKYRINYG